MIIQRKKCKKNAVLKNAMVHWKFCYDDNQIFTNESNFGIKLSEVDVWLNKPNKTKPFYFNLISHFQPGLPK